MDSRRAEGFSDGVFAVAITLLIFNLLPVGQDHLDYGALRSAWPQYVGYVVSFLTIGIMWMNHHTLFGLINRVDRPLLGINLFLLMGVVAIPFPTALIDSHLTGAASQAGQASVAAVIYGLVMIAISLGYAATWLYILTHQRKLGVLEPVELSHAVVLRFTGGLSAYVLATLIAAVWSAGIAVAIYGLTGVYYLFEHLPSPADDGPEPGIPTGIDPAEAGQPAE